MTPRSLFNSPNLPPVPSSLSLSEKALLPFLDLVAIPHAQVHAILNLIEETVAAIQQLPYEGYCRAVRFAFEGYVHPEDIPDDGTLPEAREALTDWLIGTDAVKSLRPEAIAYILWRLSRVHAAVDADVLAKHLFGLAATTYFLISANHPTPLPLPSSYSNKPSKKLTP